MKVYDLMRLLAGCHAGAEVYLTVAEGKPLPEDDAAPVSRVIQCDDGTVELWVGTPEDATKVFVEGSGEETQ